MDIERSRSKSKIFIRKIGHGDGLAIVVRKSEGSRFWFDILNNTMYSNKEQCKKRRLIQKDHEFVQTSWI